MRISDTGGEIVQITTEVNGDNHVLQEFLPAVESPSKASAPVQLDVVQNWFEELKRLVPNNCAALPPLGPQAFPAVPGSSAPPDLDL